MKFYEESQPPTSTYLHTRFLTDTPHPPHGTTMGKSKDPNLASKVVQQTNGPWVRRDRGSLQTGAHSPPQPPPSLSSPETPHAAPESQEEGGSALKPGSKSCLTTFTCVYCKYACVYSFFYQKAI